MTRRVTQTGTQTSPNLWLMPFTLFFWDRVTKGEQSFRCVWGPRQVVLLILESHSIARENNTRNHRHHHEPESPLISRRRRRAKKNARLSRLFFLGVRVCLCLDCKSSPASSLVSIEPLILRLSLRLVLFFLANSSPPLPPHQRKVCIPSRFLALVACVRLPQFCLLLSRGLCLCLPFLSFSRSLTTTRCQGI